ncbi:unnamed protein product, partial [Equus caballus papillomavirus 3]
IPKGYTIVRGPLKSIMRTLQLKQKSTLKQMFGKSCFKTKHFLLSPAELPRRTPQSLLDLAYQAATSRTAQQRSPVYFPLRLPPCLLNSSLYQRNCYREVLRGTAEALGEAAHTGAWGPLPMSPVPGPYARGELDSYLPPPACRRLYRAQLYHQRQVLLLYLQYYPQVDAGPPAGP